jgi:ABC-type transporter Mla subunit MlaD
MVTKEELDKVLSGIEESKIVISKERDKLRDLFSELSELLESFDEATDGLESGKREIENAIDTLSQYV